MGRRGWPIVALFAACALLVWLVGGDDGPRRRADVPGSNGSPPPVRPLPAVPAEPGVPAPLSREAGDTVDTPSDALEPSTVRVHFAWPADARGTATSYVFALVTSPADFEGTGGHPVDVDAPVTVERPAGDAWVVALGRGPSSFGWTEIGAADEFLVDVRDHPTLHGRVVGPSGAVAGAEVEAWTRPEGLTKHLLARVTTDAYGAYRFGPLPDDAFIRLDVTAPGLGSVERAHLVARPPSRAAPEDFALEPRESLHGRVIGPDGKPVVYAKVRFAGGASGWTRTDEAGAFACTGIDGWPVGIVAEGVSGDDDALGWVLVADATAARAGVTLELGPTTTLEGTVRWDDGSPATGFTSVRATPTADAAVFGHLLSVAGRTSPRGFLIEGLPPGRVTLHLDSPSIAYVGEHETGAPVEVVLPRPDSFEITVHPPAGETRQTLLWTSGTGASRYMDSSELDGGVFRLQGEAPHDRSTTILATFGYEPPVEVARGTAEVLDGLTVDLPLEEPLAREVAVYDRAGVPLEGVPVDCVWSVSVVEALVAPVFADDSPFDTPAVGRSIDTDALGLAVFELPAGRPAEVHVSHDGHRPVRRRVVPGETRVDIRLVPETPLSVEPRDG